MKGNEFMTLFLFFKRRLGLTIGTSKKKLTIGIYYFKNV